MRTQWLAAVVSTLAATVACSSDTASKAATSGTAARATTSAAAAPRPNDGALYDSDDRNIVKKSRSDICYDASSGVFDQTLHYRAYRTMQDCLRSGGRAAK